MDANSTLSPNSPVTLAVIPASESAYAKMKKIISSPRGKRRTSTAGSTNSKIFGVPLDDIVQRDSNDSGVPAVVQKMCQFILDNGIITEGIFRVNGNMKTVEKLKTQFDKNGDADLEETNDVMAVASLLKMFLRELPDSVIPYDMQPSFIKAHSQLRENKEQHLMVLRHLIHKMPQSNFDLLKYLIEFLNQITDSSDTNKMTPVALAVVFGPNIFRCSDTLQGLQEQACVNAITCKLIEQSAYLFAPNTSNPEDTPRVNNESSVGVEVSPRKKPARPPPPKLTQGATSPRKVCEDENSNMVDNGNVIAGSSKDGKNLTETRLELVRQEMPSSDSRSSGQSSGGKRFQNSLVISINEPNRSQSPPKPVRHISVPMAASPSRKQILDNTIHDAVKEHLFGSHFVTSSSESDTHGNDVTNSQEERTQGDSNQTPIRDMLKRYTAEKLSAADKRTRPASHSPAMFSQANNTGDTPPLETTARMNEPIEINLKLFDEMKDHWTGTLTSLTCNRAPPPRRKKNNRLQRKTQSENIDELIKNGTGYSSLEVPLGRQKNSDSNELDMDSVSKNDKNKSSNSENPLLIRIKNGRSAKLLSDVCDDADENENNPPNESMVLSSSIKVKDKTAEPENGGRPIVPPLDLFRMQQQEETEDPATRISPKERFSHVLADSPIRSPRYFSSDGQNERQIDHKQQIFLEKRQDTVPVLDMSAKDLKKRIESLKKIIANFETSFEEQHHRPPKSSEKAQVNKYIAELGRAKKQLRELMTTIKENQDRGDQTGTEAVSFAPNLRDIKVRGGKPSKEDTLNALLKRLSEKRSVSGRPEELEMMSPDQLKDEKLAVQKALLQYENLHGRPSSKEDRTLMRPIYERYRKIKRLIATPRDKQEENNAKGEEVPDTGRSQDSSDSTARDLQPIMEGEFLSGAKMSNSSKTDDPLAGNDNGLNDTFNITRKPMDFTERFETETDVSEPAVTLNAPKSTTSPGTMSEAVLHDATLDELLKQQKLAKKSRKILGKKLKDYEDDFLATTGRKVQKEDRGPLEEDYNEYKQIRARLRLLEALINKKKANQTV
ncbi:protein FAM13B-like isoform X1 [Rhopilema esculentum]|uniref:protein FAM13B-like isoform X1 n=1 Tax=Rhopilema esculentum TaxID=499914 RepID=UPI0031D7B71B